MWLTSEEVESLTKYKQAQKQREALNQMGVNHVVRPDGSHPVDRLSKVRVDRGAGG